MGHKISLEIQVKRFFMSHLKEEGCFFPYDVNAAQAKVISVLANSRSVKSKPCSTFGKCLRVPILTKYRVEKEKVFALPTVTNQVFGKKCLYSFVVLMLVCIGRDCVIPLVPLL